MDVYQIAEACLGRDYHGCGEAMAAVVDGAVVVLRYLDDAPGLPGEWVEDYPPAWREELGRVGRVVEGMASCTEFCVD